MSEFARDTVRRAYDAVAADYADTFGDDLPALAVDSGVLDATLARLDRGRSVLDVGCGPAQTGQYLGERGARVVAVDISLSMLLQARRRTGVARLVCADMSALPIGESSCAGVVAYYCLQHLPRQHLGAALTEFHRVLAERGVLTVATHLGTGEVYVDHLLDHGIDTMGGTLYERSELLTSLTAHGFAIDVVRQRDGLAHEYQSRRIYVVARRR